MDHIDNEAPPPARRHRSRAGRALGAAAAAVALMAAGFGVAAAQEEAPPTTAPPAAKAPEGEGGHPAGCEHGPGKASLDAAATAIGVSVADLRTARREGRSIADVARDEGVEPAKVVAALVAHARERIAAKVAEGDLTQAQADRRLANIEQRMTAAVDRKGRGHGGHRRGGDGGHPRRPHAPAPAEGTGTADA